MTTLVEFFVTMSCFWSETLQTATIGKHDERVILVDDDNDELVSFQLSQLLQVKSAVVAAEDDFRVETVIKAMAGARNRLEQCIDRTLR